jgi:uncharacterized protein (TIGR02147 family)
MQMETAPANRATGLLLRKFQERQLQNSRFSQRAFAQKLGVSSGALSEILKGKRALSPTQKKRMADTLQLSPQEQLDFFEDDLPENLRPMRREVFQLSVDQFHLISEWWHFGMLSLLRTRGFRLDQDWIAGRLGLSAKVASEALDRLFRLGHLKRAGGKVLREHARVETTDEFFDLSVQKSHLENAKLIEKSILENPLEVRDHTSLTIAVSRKNMKRAKELIRLFEDQFEREIEAAPDLQADEVYRLSISFFPLTKIKEKP